MSLPPCVVIATNDIAAILSQLKTKPALITQEVIFGAGEDIQPSEYVQNGKCRVSCRYLVELTLLTAVRQGSRVGSVLASLWFRG